MNVGITGHQRLGSRSEWVWVREAMGQVLSAFPRPFTGVTSLAVGADQMFAQIVLRVGGFLHVVIPFPGYESTFSCAKGQTAYRRYLKAADQVETLDRRGSDEESFLAAGERVVTLSDTMVAVWDGRPARGLGGTADIVRYALRSGKRVHHINPVARRVEHPVRICTTKLKEGRDGRPKVGRGPA